MTNIDDVAQTLAEYERLAITSGARVQIDPPEFSGDGVTWSPVWLAADPPAAARAKVHRDGIPTEVYAVWAESLPVDTAQSDDGRLWRDIWEQKPVQRFGSFVVRKAISRAFREVIGERVEPDEDAPRVPAARVDWDRLIEIAGDIDVLDDHWAKMRTARARSGAREVAYKKRRAELVEAMWTAEVAEDLAAAPHPGPARPGRAPQDHQPPANRAARRARQKGRRK